MKLLELPQDLINFIFKYLDIPSVMLATSCCKSLYTDFNTNSITSIAAFWQEYSTLQGFATMTLSNSQSALVSPSSSSSSSSSSWWPWSSSSATNISSFRAQIMHHYVTSKTLLYRMFKQAVEAEEQWFKQPVLEIGPNDQVTSSMPRKRKRRTKHLFKVILLGDSGVGKTSFMNRYVVRYHSCGV